MLNEFAAGLGLQGLAPAWNYVWSALPPQLQACALKLWSDRAKLPAGIAPKERAAAEIWVAMRAITHSLEPALQGELLGALVRCHGLHGLLVYGLFVQEPVQVRVRIVMELRKKDRVPDQLDLDHWGGAFVVAHRRTR